MKVLVEVNHSKVKLSLISEEKTLGGLEWKDQNDTSVKFLEQLEQLLKKQNLSIREIDYIENKYTDKNFFTTARIIKSITQTINYCLES